MQSIIRQWSVSVFSCENTTSSIKLEAHDILQLSSTKDWAMVTHGNMYRELCVVWDTQVDRHTDTKITTLCGPPMVKSKGKGFPYSTPSVGPEADPGVQAVSPQVTVSHPPGGMLPLLSARPAVTSPAAEHHRSLVGTKLYCLVTEVHRCEQLAQGCYAALPWAGFELATCWSQAQTPYPLHQWYFDILF